eukprot:TRINITY_DN2098_c0_g1_i1.p1 TRINITY_DN2098_c0_g1~~TRINITY_DN2098_c0_g1_i1.p1  ORF type:complete len:569 (+),score=127.20 TRINITY_DN2098_c0_g1_i1:2537-4243(+)
MFRFSALLVCAAAFLLATVFAELKFDDGDAVTTVLASYGDASATVNVLVKGAADSTPEVSSSSLFSVGTPSVAEAAGGYTNYSIPMSFNGGVGSTTYTVTVGDESITGTVIVAGFVIMADGQVVSGDDGEGISVGQSGTTTYEVKAVGVDGGAVDISGTSISGKELSGPYMKEIDMSGTSISSTTFTLKIATLRVGTGNFLINFDAPAISMGGESFETVLNVKQATSPEPACVAYGGAITTSGGMIKVPMFNLMTPPKASAVRKVTVTIGSTSADWDVDSSSLTLPDHMVAFRISAAGVASITCDGEPAVVMGGDIVASGDDSAAALATSLITEIPRDGSTSVFSAVISVVDSSPDMLLASDAQKILDRFCSVIGSSNCAIEGVTSGSAILDCAGEIDEGDAAAAEAALNEEFDSCEFQTATGYECDKLRLGEMSVTKAVAGAGGAAAAAGLATWTIVLIAAVGAFALILVIVLGLWAVYRRSAEQSESDYSSSGPLGVPDPSDLLYEQSIVRDIYGRGDFPEGGPSAAVAEQRAREAELREETPRPPSSSGVSRGAGTDDASSTYSV